MIDFLGKSPEELLTTQDIAALAQSRLAGRKGAGDGMRYAVVLNKADTRKRRDAALEVWEAMDRRKEIRVIVTANGWVV